MSAIVVYRAFSMHALAGCKLLSGCLKCCGTSSVKWRCLLTSAVLALFSSWSAVLPWLLRIATNYSTSKISDRIFFATRGARPQVPQRRFRALKVRRYEASKIVEVEMGLAPALAYLGATLPKPFTYNKLWTPFTYNKLPATLCCTMLSYTDDIFYEPQVPCQAGSIFQYPMTWSIPSIASYCAWHSKMISPCLMV